MRGSPKRGCDIDGAFLVGLTERQTLFKSTRRWWLIDYTVAMRPSLPQQIFIYHLLELSDYGDSRMLIGTGLAMG